MKTYLCTKSSRSSAATGVKTYKLDFVSSPLCRLIALNLESNAGSSTARALVSVAACHELIRRDARRGLTKHLLARHQYNRHFHPWDPLHPLLPPLTNLHSQRIIHPRLPLPGISFFLLLRPSNGRKTQKQDNHTRDVVLVFPYPRGVHDSVRVRR